MRSPPPNTTTSFQFQVVRANESAVNDLVTDVYTMVWSGTNLSTVSVNIRKAQRFNHQYFRCFSGNLNFGTPGSDTKLTRPITIIKDYRNAYLAFGVDGYKPEPYGLEIDGVRQSGVYLGARNKTTWGFNY